MGKSVEAATEEWFQETGSRLNNLKSDTPEDNLLCSVVPVAHNYCKAAFLLANHNHTLPAMALLRILAELTIRMLWCLYEDNSKKEAPCIRIMRWWKTTCQEEYKHLRNIRPSSGIQKADSTEQAMTSLQREIDKGRIPEFRGRHTQFGAEIGKLSPEFTYGLSGMVTMALSIVTIRYCVLIRLYV